MHHKNKIIHIAADSSALFRDAAKLIIQTAKECIRKNGEFIVALSGGSTPKSLYEEIVSSRNIEIDWSLVHFFFSDERYVPLNHPESNGGMAKKYLFEPLSVVSSQIHFVPTDLISASEAAAQYEINIKTYFSSRYRLPEFDMILLGLGDDGHTASLFPGTKALAEQNKYVVENWVKKLDAWRITFTYPLLNNGKNVIFIATSSQKAGVANEILNNPDCTLPACRVRPAHGRLYWYLDKAAAIFLKN